MACSKDSTDWLSVASYSHGDDQTVWADTVPSPTEPIADLWVPIDTSHLGKIMAVLVAFTTMSIALIKFFA